MMHNKPSLRVFVEEKIELCLRRTSIRDIRARVSGLI